MKKVPAIVCRLECIRQAPGFIGVTTRLIYRMAMFAVESGAPWIRLAMRVGGPVLRFKCTLADSSR